MKLGKLLDLRHELGRTGLMSLALLGGALLFMLLVVQPLQIKQRDLQSTLARQSGQPGTANGNAAERVGALYRYLEKPEQTTDWLAKLYAIGTATGVELQSASYRSEKSGRLERTQIVLPLTGSYAQMRDFLKRALAEIPVLSLDQMTLKRETRRDGAVQAELRLTLHMVKP
jgi:Tfp pilus assembly protein PilO